MWIVLPANSCLLPTSRIEYLALRLCDGFNHMRCDLYLVGDAVYFGEYKIFNQGGYVLLDGDHTLLRAQDEAWHIRQTLVFPHPIELAP